MTLSISRNGQQNIYGFVHFTKWTISHLGHNIYMSSASWSCQTSEKEVLSLLLAGQVWSYTLASWLMSPLARWPSCDFIFSFGTASVIVSLPRLNPSMVTTVLIMNKSNLRHHSYKVYNICLNHLRYSFHMS